MFKQKAGIGYSRLFDRKTVAIQKPSAFITELNREADDFICNTVVITYK